jgi:hypothetical protein
VWRSLLCQPESISTLTFAISVIGFVRAIAFAVCMACKYRFSYWLVSMMRFLLGDRKDRYLAVCHVFLSVVGSEVEVWGS